MRRFDVIVGTSLALLAGFVGYEAMRTRTHLGAMEHRTASASYGSAPMDTLAEPTVEAPIAGSPAPAARPAGVRDDILRRLELSSGGTFIGEVLAAHDSALARWPDRVLQPLRVWIQPDADLAGFQEDFVPVVRRAFSRWSDVGIPVAFTFLVDSSRADVHVTWVDQFREPISGKTIWAHDDQWWIIDAQIQLAVQHQGGTALDTTAVSAIAMHEVGHLLGLDHTSDTTSIMAPKVRVKDLSPADRATVQLLYRLPAGRVRR